VELLTYQYTIDHLNELANQIKEAVIQGLEDEDLLKKDAEGTSGEYVVVLNRPEGFGRIWRKLRGIKPEDEVLRIVFMRTVLPLKAEKEEWL
jgi:hypothetical protein